MNASHLRLFFFFLLFLLLTKQTFAEEKQVALQLFEAIENEPLNQVIITTKILDKETNKVLTITEYAVDNEIALTLPKEADIEFIVDVPSTEGKDFYLKKQSSDLNASQKIYLLPIATLNIIVLDELDNRVQYADISIRCEKDYGIDYPRQTDKYGSFSSVIPIGSCTIHAEKGEEGRSLDIETTRGETATAEMKLKSISFLVIAIFFLFVVLAALWFGVKKMGILTKKAEEKSGVNKRESSTTSQNERINTIMKTLNAREKRVTTHLLQNEGYSTQANIRHSTKIPKTSLSRVLDSLQKKGILAYNSDGAMKKVQLTQWFLKGEEPKSATNSP